MISGIKIKETGIISGYIFLLAGVLFLDYEPFLIFLTFILDFLSTVIVLGVVDFLNKSKKKKNLFNSIHIVITGFLLALVQGAFIMLLASLMQSKSLIEKKLDDLYWLVPCIFIPALILKLIELRKEQFDAKLVDKKRGEMMTHAVTFPAMLLMGLLTHELVQSNQIKVTLTVMLIARLIIEIYMNHIQNRKSK